MEFLPTPPPTTPTEESQENCDRLLTAEEINSFVLPKYKAAGHNLPNPAVSVFVGSIREGKIVAALCLQLRLHAEPLIVEEGHGAVVSSLAHYAEQHVLKTAGPQVVYLFAPIESRTAQLAISLGMTQEPWVVMSKVLEHPTPSTGPIDFGLDSMIPVTEVKQ